jgi:hypothetical protein
MKIQRQDPRKRNELDKSNRGGRATNGKEEEQREHYPGEEAVEQDEEGEGQIESFKERMHWRRMNKRKNSLSPIQERRQWSRMRKRKNS